MDQNDRCVLNVIAFSVFLSYRLSPNNLAHCRCTCVQIASHKHVILSASIMLEASTFAVLIATAPKNSIIKPNELFSAEVIPWIFAIVICAGISVHANIVYHICMQTVCTVHAKWMCPRLIAVFWSNQDRYLNTCNWNIEAHGPKIATIFRMPETQCAKYCASTINSTTKIDLQVCVLLKLCGVGDVSQSAIFSPMLQWSKAAAMYWASPKLLQSCHVSSGSISLMLCKAILGPLLMILIHQLVPGHLCMVWQQ